MLERKTFSPFECPDQRETVGVHHFQQAGECFENALYERRSRLVPESKSGAFAEKRPTYSYAFSANNCFDRDATFTYISAATSPSSSRPTTPAEEALYPPMMLSSSSRVGLKESESQESSPAASSKTPADNDRIASW